MKSCSSPEVPAARRLTVWLVAGRFLFCLWATQASGAVETAVSSGLTGSTPSYREDRILIQPKPGIAPQTLASFHSAQNCGVLQTFESMGGLQILALPEGETVKHCLAQYQQSGLVQVAEPDYFRQLAATPNDSAYTNGTLWGLNNLGQGGGTPDADIDAPEGWDVLTSASNIVVAVLDTGVRATHEDLATNMWVNPADGGHGWNAFTWDSNPADDEGHGTLISGILGAEANNGKGVVGVAWRVQIMACKCIDSNRKGSDSDVIICIDYARSHGARIINASWGGYTNSYCLSNAIYTARNAGIILVAASGNDGRDIDTNPLYPASYTLDNIVSVAATTRNDTLASFSNYGATNVHLAAPGTDIYSTFFTADNMYLGGSYLKGTSFAVPYVTGALALLLAKYPAETHQQIISRLLSATDPLPAFAGKCVTGGRLNLRKALSPPIWLLPIASATDGAFQLRVSAGPNRKCIIQTASDLTSWSPVFTNTTSSAGTFDFTDPQSTNLTRRFYRVVSWL